MRIERFNPDNLDKVAEMIIPHWGHPGSREELDRVFCGHIARHHYLCPELSFQIEDEEGLRGICWAAYPGSRNDSAGWMESNLYSLTAEEKQEVLKDADYLRYADALMEKFMGTNDIKMTLIITDRKGYGSVLLEHLMEQLSGKGFGYLSSINQFPQTLRSEKERTWHH